MEVLRRGYENGKEFFTSIIEWRSAATAPYFMLINTAFWWSVFYMREELQQRLLISLAAGVFGWDVLLSSTHEHSILVHLISWPIHNTLRTISVVLALLSAYSLQSAQLEKACWMAYSTVALLMLNPVWRYQKVPEKINYVAYQGYCFTKHISYHCVVRPTLVVYKVIQYIVLLRWLSAFWNYTKRVYFAIVLKLSNLWCSFVHSLRSMLTSVKCWIVAKIRAIKDAIIGSLRAIKNWFIGKVKAICSGIRNAFCALLRAIRNTFIAIGHFIRDKFWAAVRFIKNSLSAIGAWICGRMKAFGEFVRNKIIALKQWIRRRMMEPLKKRAVIVGRFLRFWLCAHWWPRLKHSFDEEIGRPLQKAFNYFCYYLIYLFTFRWRKPLAAYLAQQMRKFQVYLRRTVFVPLKRWIRARLDDLYVAIKKVLHRLAVAIVNSVVWPFCVIIGNLMKEAYNYIHATVLQPFYEYLYSKYKMCEDYTYIYVLGPACETLVNNIPEKSPFCDDSDNEVAGLLPQSADEDEGNYTDTEGTASDLLSFASGSLTSLSEDERDFLRGLKFPSIDASDTSDEEFDLYKAHRRPKTHKSVPKDPAPAAYDSAEQPSESNGNEQPHAHRLSVSSTSSLSDGASSTRSDALINAKLSFGDSNSDADPERFLSPSLKKTSMNGEKSQQGVSSSSSGISSMHSPSQSIRTTSTESRETLVDAGLVCDPTDSSGLKQQPTFESRQSNGNRRSDSVPRSTTSAQNQTTTTKIDEQFEVLDLAR